MKKVQWMRMVLVGLMAGALMWTVAGCSDKDDDDDNGGAPASAFTRITPGGLQATLTQGTATTVRYSLTCAPIEGARRYTFTTSRGHTEGSASPQINVTLDSGGPVQWEVFATNADGENTRTARASFNAVSPGGSLPGAPGGSVPGANFAQLRPTNLRAVRVGTTGSQSTYELSCDPVPGATRYNFATSELVPGTTVRNPSARVRVPRGRRINWFVHAINADGTRSQVAEGSFNSE